MAFRQPALTSSRPLSLTTRPQHELAPLTASPFPSHAEESQEWVLFSPSQAASTTADTQTTSTPRTFGTAGLSRVSDLDSLDTAARSAQHDASTITSALDEGLTEDGELDSLDEGLHAFREQPEYRSSSTGRSPGGVLPTHDGLGTFPASSSTVQDQLWHHEQYNPKRKFEGYHQRRSSAQRRLDTIEELDSQIDREKRLRIEKWRMDQSQVLLEEIEKETRRQRRRESSKHDTFTVTNELDAENTFGTTPKQSDFDRPVSQSNEPPEPFWRRITMTFIRDVIGIDEPLLSVILGETLPPELSMEISEFSSLSTIPEQTQGRSDTSLEEESWRDRLLRRIARELGVIVNQFSSHPSAFSEHSINDYAGIPIASSSGSRLGVQEAPYAVEESMNIASTLNPTFSPTLQDPSHAASWGLEDDSVPTGSSNSQPEDAERLRREREYWEKELDVKMVFRFLKNRFTSSTPAQHSSQSIQTNSQAQDPARRAAIIRQHHPLVARAPRSPVRLRRDARPLVRHSSSSCASESVKSSRRASLVRSGGSSRNYWDIGGSVGSGSMGASGEMMGAWGEV